MALKRFFQFNGGALYAQRLVLNVMVSWFFSYGSCACWTFERVKNYFKKLPFFPFTTSSTTHKSWKEGWGLCHFVFWTFQVYIFGFTIICILLRFVCDLVINIWRWHSSHLIGSNNILSTQPPSFNTNYDGITIKMDSWKWTKKNL